MQLKQYANSRGVQIIGDMPLYVASDSVDVWAHREMFLLEPDGRPNVVAGAAPDAFSESGQVWGSPVYDWNVMEEDGFAWWKARMLENMELFDVIRLDHFPVWCVITPFLQMQKTEEMASGAKDRAGN